jgi:hypothetical protein
MNLRHLSRKLVGLQLKADNFVAGAVVHACRHGDQLTHAERTACSIFVADPEALIALDWAPRLTTLVLLSRLMREN